MKFKSFYAQVCSPRLWASNIASRNQIKLAVASRNKCAKHLLKIDGAWELRPVSSQCFLSNELDVHPQGL